MATTTPGGGHAAPVLMPVVGNQPAHRATRRRMTARRTGTRVSRLSLGEAPTTRRGLFVEQWDTQSFELVARSRFGDRVASVVVPRTATTAAAIPAMTHLGRLLDLLDPTARTSARCPRGAVRT